jgi:hypothetical protein
LDRYGLFVDAGYPFAEAGGLCAGTKRRSELRCDHAGLVEGLRALAGRHSGLPPLRIYWYDGARDAVPSVTQRRLANLPDLKLRLGRIVRLTQKGVDSLIVSDLITLAHERAIVTAYVLTGDEEVREGIAAAQALGSLRERPGVKAELRAGFWRGLLSGPLVGTCGGVDGPSRPASATGRIV